MRDGLFKTGLKRLVLGVWSTELRAQRGLRRIQGAPQYRLGGACARCSRCCDAPGIQVDRLTWYLPTLRRAFLGWQQHLNGFVLVGADSATRTFAFRCTHFDAVARRCDSYSSRPGLCRDYPRALLGQAWPELFAECGFRPISRTGAGLSAALGETGLDPLALAELRRRLKLD